METKDQDHLFPAATENYLWDVIRGKAGWFIPSKLRTALAKAVAHIIKLSADLESLNWRYARQTENLQGCAEERDRLLAAVTDTHAKLSESLKLEIESEAEISRLNKALDGARAAIEKAVDERDKLHTQWSKENERWVQRARKVENQLFQIKKLLQGDEAGVEAA